MIIEEERIIKDGSEIVLRCARADEAEMILAGYKKLLSETKFLACESDEMNFTVEQERAFIERKNSAKNSVFVLAFVDGRYAGHCGFDGNAESRRTAHRAMIGISIFQQFTGRGLGGLMLEKLFDTAKKAGFKQIELRVYADNVRARKLYKKLGFTECGIIPDAARFSDGTASDEILMYKIL